MKRGRPEVLVMSFHGIPRRAVDRGDPYERECHETATLLAEALGLAAGQYRVAFQSRFGRAEWLQPYTAELLAELGRQRLDPVDAICPGFVSDCLETLEEIRIEGKALFVEAGGGELRYIPCLNDRHEWIAALTDMVERSLEAWSLPGGPETLQASCRRAEGRAHA
jgi:ferrochelatase